MTVLNLHSEPLQAAWLDDYGHLNEAYYLVPFSNATWALQNHFCIGTDYFEETGGALYTLESHIRYVREIRPPADISLSSMILDVDAKRLRLAHVMLVEGVERATFECTGIHFDSRAGRTAPFPDDVFARLRESKIAEMPDWAGRQVALK